jgi:hypothetical protein
VSDPKHFIISLRCGRLANRLTIFANFIALAEERGWRVSNVTFHSYADMFLTTRADIYCRYPVTRRRSVLDRLPGVATALRKTRLLTNAAKYASRYPKIFRNTVTLHELPGKAVIYLDQEFFQAQIRGAEKFFVHGWKFRAPALVKKHAAKIREFFRPAPAIAAQAQAQVAPLRTQAEVVVGVHIRQGDYRGWLGGKYFFPVERYAAWMREIPVQFPGKRVAFFVCSDEPRTAAEFAGLTVAFGGSPLADNLSLSACDFIIGPVSTFSQWASFYGGKPLFHLKNTDAVPDLKNAAMSDLDFIE